MRDRARINDGKRGVGQDGRGLQRKLQLRRA